MHICNSTLNLIRRPVVRFNAYPVYWYARQEITDLVMVYLLAMVRQYATLDTHYSSCHVSSWQFRLWGLPMKRSAAIYHAKEAYKLWLYRGIKTQGFHVGNDGFGFEIEDWFVYLGPKGQIQGANQPEKE